MAWTALISPPLTPSPAGADDAFQFIGAAAFTAIGQVRAFQAGGSTFVAVNLSGNAAPEMYIQFTGLMTLDAADFIL
jgi:hypothetical protein